ncbi:MAG TPA: response regulator [Candidatus Sulfotelmatobacter sp.]|nr:response regulator [Candidatus Sulfotelmatobacter sp.]
MKTIFFVEDSDVERLAYQKALERAGYCVQAARDGLEGMRLLHNIVPDLVLLDLLLPKFDGVELLKFMRSDARLKTVPVVIFSTNSIIEAQDEPLLEGANRRLLKSQCNPSMLLATINDVLAEHLGHVADDESKNDHLSQVPATAAVSTRRT